MDLDDSNRSRYVVIRRRGLLDKSGPSGTGGVRTYVHPDDCRKGISRGRGDATLGFEAAGKGTAHRADSPCRPPGGTPGAHRLGMPDLWVGINNRSVDPYPRDRDAVRGTYTCKNVRRSRDAVEGGKTFTAALQTLRNWHYRLRVAKETLKASPEPHRAWMSLKGLVQSLVSSNSEFALEWGEIMRSVGMREGATLEKLELLIPMLEVELSQRSQDESVRKHVSEDRHWTHEAEARRWETTQEWGTIQQKGQGWMANVQEDADDGWDETWNQGWEEPEDDEESQGWGWEDGAEAAVVGKAQKGRKGKR